MATTGRTDLTDLLDALDRLAHLDCRIARTLHDCGLLSDRNHLNLIAQADQLDAAIDQARTRHTRPQPAEPHLPKATDWPVASEPGKPRRERP